MMTTAQRDALDKAIDILGEHFDSFVLITSRNDDEQNQQLHASHTGGYYNALGMLNAAVEHYLDGHTGTDEEFTDL